MVTTLIVLSVIISILLIFIVLIQKSKGGGLASNFSGSNQIMGVRRTTNFIEKATWTLASIVAILAIVSGIMLTRGSGSKESVDEAFERQSVTNTTDANQGTGAAVNQTLGDTPVSVPGE